MVEIVSKPDAQIDRDYEIFSKLSEKFSKNFPASIYKDSTKPDPSEEDLATIDSIKKAFPKPALLVDMIIQHPPALWIDRSLTKDPDTQEKVEPIYSIEPVEEDLKSYLTKLPKDASKGLEKNGIRVNLSDNEKQILDGNTRLIMKFLGSQTLRDNLDEKTRDLYEKNISRLLDIFDKNDDGQPGIYLKEWMDRLQNNKLKGKMQTKAISGIMTLSTIKSLPEDIRHKLTEIFLTSQNIKKDIPEKEKIGIIVDSSKNALELLFGKVE